MFLHKPRRLLDRLTIGRLQPVQTPAPKVSGWVRPDPNGRTSAFALFGRVFDDEGMWTMTPLAIVRLAPRVFWITAVTLYESSSFVIRDVSPSAIRDVLTSDNGGC